MSESKIEKYSAKEWDYIRKRFYNSILNETEIAKLGQNVGISWPFKGKDETPAKYIDLEFEELQSVPGLVGKMSRVKVLMDILRETLAFDDPFGDMVDTVENESQEDDTFNRILEKLEVPMDYPAEFLHFSKETEELLQSEDVKTLMECVHFGQNIARNAVMGGDLKSFLNSLAHKDEKAMSTHMPYRRGERGLHLAEAIGLICRSLNTSTQLHLLQVGGVTLTGEEQQKLASSSKLDIEGSMKRALDKLSRVGEWFSAEVPDLEQTFTTEGSPERYFISINDARIERMAVELARLKFAPEEEKKSSGFLGRIFGR
ncbi:hypothetical protein DDZ13_09085 [Coraliomargarita sinensis]|uniref:Uncharacterized protein n=1 Tax=Coraliomargarita sinensis TaxID=2174842 RepID=A0A317ZLD1_9BACT|nr:hypothetical protein [Coraliomargarita sinensis]PXA04181.1 hypothetical protein DDZ13_09085 [Coraliomargarita sinensis]